MAARYCAIWSRNSLIAYILRFCRRTVGGFHQFHDLGFRAVQQLCTGLDKRRPLLKELQGFFQRDVALLELPDDRLLFPELTDSDISEIHIRAGDDCAFDFSVRGELSVNGQKADGEVFSTLLDQLTADCFIPCEDFEPRGEPLLTVMVSTDTQDFSARFYQDSEDGKYAYVVAGAGKARCLKTDAWRVGTLLLTCEGTRIFDASGQETPVD